MDQSVAPPVGSVEITTLPARSAPQHHVVEVHVMDVRFGESMAIGLDHATELVGSVELTRSPSLSTATHNVVDVVVQESEGNASADDERVAPVAAHELAPAAGSVDAHTSSPSSAMHRFVLGHEIDWKSESEGDEKFHAEEPPVGFVEVTTPGRYSPPDMPTQRSALGHEIDPM
jgi:hypothetical protein